MILESKASALGDIAKAIVVILESKASALGNIAKAKALDSNLSFPDYFKNFNFR